MAYYLHSHGYLVNRKRIQRLMQVLDLEAIYPKPQLSQINNKEHRIYTYLLRNMAIVRPNQVWSTDITYLRLAGGFAYLAAYIDWYSRFILSFEVSTTLDHMFCIAALKSALKYGSAEIHNTDQGRQFTCQAYIDIVTAAGMKISMDGKGRALDNVFVERLGAPSNTKIFTSTIIMRHGKRRSACGVISGSTITKDRIRRLAENRRRRCMQKSNSCAETNIRGEDGGTHSPHAPFKQDVYYY